MGRIAVEGMRFFAYHGYYPEERRKGSNFTVDLYLHTDFSKAAKSDELEGTINYESLAEIVNREMELPSKLLEHVAFRIHQSIIRSCPGITYLKVRLSKHEPPIKGKVDRTCVELDTDSPELSGRPEMEP